MPVHLVNSSGSPTKAILIIWRSRVRNSPPAHTSKIARPPQKSEKKLTLSQNAQCFFEMSKKKTQTQEKPYNTGTIDIHKYARRIEYSKKNLLQCRDGSIGIQFLEKLKLFGLSDGRITVYGERTRPLLEIFEKINVRICDATKKDCETVLSDILSRGYGGESRQAFALTLLRLVHYAKKDEIGNRDDGYCKEVSWIKPTKYNIKEEKIRSEDLLDAQEVQQIIGKTTNRRDRAMFWTMFEGAFRPGELLNLKVGGVEFKENYVLLSTHGKTGNKRVALVVSFKPLLEWLHDHPLQDDPHAPLWYSYSPRSKTKQVSYGYLREQLKRCTAKAKIKRRVWNYLFRHSQLTMLSKKLSDQTLCVYGNWSPGSEMVKKYVHLSGKDAEDAILELHGIKVDDKDNIKTTVQLKSCYRCSEQNTPESQRCSNCGFILDEQLLASAAESDQVILQDMLKRLQKLEKSGESIGASFENILKQKPVVFSTRDVSP